MCVCCVYFHSCFAHRPTKTQKERERSEVAKPEDDRAAAHDDGASGPAPHAAANARTARLHASRWSIPLRALWPRAKQHHGPECDRQRRQGHGRGHQAEIVCGPLGCERLEHLALWMPRRPGIMLVRVYFVAHHDVSAGQPYEGVCLHLLLHPRRVHRHAGQAPHHGGHQGQPVSRLFNHSILLLLRSLPNVTRDGRHGLVTSSAIGPLACNELCHWSTGL